jgi:twitching motility protein PilT
MVRKLIREGGEDRLADLITGDTGLGMHDFTQDLARLVREGQVDVRVAYEVAPNPEALKSAIRGIASRGGAL